MTHKKDFRLYIWKLVGDEINLFKRFKSVHTGLITELRADGENIVTAARDKKVNIYTIDYKFDFKL